MVTLVESVKTEIIQAFNVFDEKRTGTITPNNLKLLVRALGFRVTKNQIFRDIIEAKRRLRRGINECNNDNYSDEGDIDLDLVLDVMETKYNKEIDPIAEMKINFRLFDAENKGYIQVSDLKRVIQELEHDCDKFGLGPLDSNLMLQEDQLKAMIEEFDADQDSVINFAEFKRIMEFA